MKEDDTQHAAKVFAELADDFLFDILLLKANDKQNRSLPFLHAQALELSTKAVCYKSGIDFSKLRNGHDIVGICNLIAVSLPGIKPLIPTPEDLVSYKKFFVPSNAPNRDVHMPPPKDLHKIELAYFVDNAMNLKYGFTKELIQISIIGVSYAEMNTSFMALFNFCRHQYATDELNKRIRAKVLGFFKPPDTEERLKDLLKI
jgi:hypothetical protein